MSKTYNNNQKKNVILSHHYGDQYLFWVCLKMTVFSFSDSAC